jgi:ATP-binding cassette subfamily B protein RaxB
VLRLFTDLWGAGRQIEIGECGLACLARIAEVGNRAFRLDELRREYPCPPQGSSFGRLAEIALELGFEVNAIKCTAYDLRKLRLPAILHWRGSHFVVLERLTLTGAIIFEPQNGRRNLSAVELARAYSGAVLELNKPRQAKPIRAAYRSSNLKRAWPVAVVPALLCVVGFSLVLHVVIWSCAWAIATIILRGPAHAPIAWLESIASIGAVCACAAMRTAAVAAFAGKAKQLFTRRMIARLCVVPIPWLERRSALDLQARLGWSDALRSVLEIGAAAWVDELLSSLALCATLFWFGWPGPTLALMQWLALVVVLTVALSLQPYRNSNNAITREQGRLLRAVVRVRTSQGPAANGATLFAQWERRERERSRVERTYIRSMRIVLAFCLTVIFAYLVAVLAWGRRFVQNGSVSWATFVATASYAGLAVTRFRSAARAVEPAIDLAGQFNSVLDIIATELKAQAGSNVAGETTGRMTLSNLHLSYGTTKIFNDISAELRPKELTVLTGLPGSGKTTLLKLLAGDYIPTAGTINWHCTSPHPGQTPPPPGQIASIFGPIILLPGSIAENVSMYAQRPNHDIIWDCLRSAEAEDDIRALTRGIHEMVHGQMSSWLRLRIALARAIYQQPKILLFDDPGIRLSTSVDLSLAKVLGNFPATRIVVTRRTALLNIADCVLRLSPSGLTEITPAIHAGLDKHRRGYPPEVIVGYREVNPEF